MNYSSGKEASQKGDSPNYYADNCDGPQDVCHVNKI